MLGHQPFPLSTRCKGLPWILRRRPTGRPSTGLLAIGTQVIACRIGRSGIRARKKEGDGATPAGTLSVIGGFRNPARRSFARGSRTLRIAHPALGWCDDARSMGYNRPARLPMAASHETLLRDDRLYDLCLVLNWNLRPRILYRGSAIFLHHTAPVERGTAGCIALEPALLARLLPLLLRQRIKVIA